MAKELWKGNEAIAEAAVRGGCRYFFGYPITPQNEIPEYMASKLPGLNGCFLQAESEVAAINMVYGAAGAGARVMTSSSSPGISLKSEGISYIAGAELPCVIVNIMRSGPGLGGILPSQSDYFQACKGGGHGDYHSIVFAPGSVQEAADIVQESFDIADQYRIPVMILGDGILGQMMEPVEFGSMKRRSLPEKTWATDGTKGKREKNVINSLNIEAAACYEHNLKLQKKYRTIEENETRVETYNIEGSQIIFAAFGTTARIVRSAIKLLEKQGIKAGLIRPITVWPFPKDTFRTAADLPDVKAFLTVEMNMGQMVEDVKLSVEFKKPVYFFGKAGGIIPTPAEIAENAIAVLGGVK